MNDFTPKPPDVVLLSFARDSLRPLSEFTIVDARVIGSAAPSADKLKAGASLLRAVMCLKNHGFSVVCRVRTDERSGLVLLERSYA